MNPVTIIGMGLSPRDLTEAQRKKIEAADVLVGGRRHLDGFEQVSAEKKEITKKLSDVVAFIKEKMHRHTVVVLASGDPLFYGIGSLLIDRLGPENIVVYSNITSVGGAFARIKEAWQDAKIVSLHGRDHETELLNAMAFYDKIAVFTDPEKTPAWVAKRLIENRLKNFKMCVLEQLGAPGERIGWYSLDQAVDKTFRDPNLVILKRLDVDENQPASTRPIRLGAPDDQYAHPTGLITKAEVRVVAISKLRLESHHVFWDLGAGSGSVSIEAALFVKTGHLFAVEKNAERIAQIKENRKRFNVENLHIVQSDLPGGLETLPRPDRIFIGGGGEGLERIINAASASLKPGGVVVVNTVLLENVNISRKTLQGLDYRTDVVQVQINRGHPMPWGERLEAQNPVWIVTGEKTR